MRVRIRKARFSAAHLVQGERPEKLYVLDYLCASII